MITSPIHMCGHWLAYKSLTGMSLVVHDSESGLSQVEEQCSTDRRNIGISCYHKCRHLGYHYPMQCIGHRRGRIAKLELNLMHNERYHLDLFGETLVSMVPIFNEE